MGFHTTHTVVTSYGKCCVHVTAYVAVRRSLSTTYTAVVLGLLLRQYVSYQFGVWAVYLPNAEITPLGAVHFACRHILYLLLPPPVCRLLSCGMLKQLQIHFVCLNYKVYLMVQRYA